MEEKLIKYFQEKDLDIRKKDKGYSRAMDQKLTPDVLSFIADCIVNFCATNGERSDFDVNSIWTFPYFVKNTMAVFGKPSPSNFTANAEYNKFIGQPLKTLAYAGVISETKKGNKNVYKVTEPDLINFISVSEKNAYIFLVKYIEKLLLDSGFIIKFYRYRDKAKDNILSKDDFKELKEEFQKFWLGFTEINGITEINRIFPKVLNPLATYYEIPGSIDGEMSSGRFIFPDLMYNRRNFRDIGKDKTATRQEAIKDKEELPELITYRVQKAKNIIKRLHNTSELRDSLATGSATQVHHIFPESSFPEISDYLENLILLTPQQHNTRAHPNNRTKEIDASYQKECILSKIDSIASNSEFYSRVKLIHVINVGYGLTLPTSTSFEEIRNAIREINA